MAPNPDLLMFFAISEIISFMTSNDIGNLLRRVAGCLRQHVSLGLALLGFRLLNGMGVPLSFT